MSKPSQESPATPSVAAHAPVQVQFDPTPPLGHDVLALFRGPFADVRFPDVDRTSLEADARALLLRQAEAESLERELERARHDTREAAAVLNASAGRALAYAKVFAMGQPQLEEALRSVRAGQGEATTERGLKKRRGRPASHAGEQLPMVTAAAEAAPLDGSEDAEDHDLGHHERHEQAAE
jgi:hypothetical protein